MKQANFFDPLPIDAHLAEIRAALAHHANLIIKAEPASGKTTRIPPALLDVVPGVIIVLEPRRLAARLAAEYMAGQMGEAVGATVGYQIRFAGESSAATRILFVTEGVFTRIIQDNPTLKGIGCVIIDEFHERHIQTDVALAYSRAVMEKARPDLKLIVMSATLDTSALEAYLPHVAVFDIKGRAAKVDIVYLDEAPRPGERKAGLSRALARMLQDERCPGNILVFLTGMQEIQTAMKDLAPLAADAGAVLLPLTAEIAPTEQKRVFAPLAARKIVLATNVAETSLTLPGVTGVIDLGLAKIASHASWSGLVTLDVKKVCAASCTQRAGRAGRVQDGVCYRLYSEADFYSRPRFLAPEICRLDLAQTMLETHALFDGDAQNARAFTELLPWFELPAPAHVAAARAQLQLLGAFDPPCRITDKGRRMARIPLHPRLAAMVVEGEARSVQPAALLAACLINEDMLLDKGADAVDITTCDVRYQMGLLLAPEGKGRQQRVIDSRKAGRIKQLYSQLAARLGVGPCRSLAGLDSHAFTLALLAGFPDRIARLRQAGPTQQRAFNLCLGRGGFLARSSTVQNSECIIAIDATESHSRKDAAIGTQIRVASAVTADLLLSLNNSFAGRRVVTRWDARNESATSVEELAYGQLALGERQLPREQRREEQEALLARVLAEKWPYPFGDDNPLDVYHAKLAILLQLGIAHDLPTFTGELLALFLALVSEGKSSIAQVRDIDLAAIISAQLSYDQNALLEETLPAQVRLSNGRSFAIHYSASAPPFISGRIQDFFGVSFVPRIAGGRLALTLRLLAPNSRPAQTTADLASFWQNAYPQLAAELSRRYPKHYWPEDPRKAAPVLLKKQA